MGPTDPLGLAYAAPYVIQPRPRVWTVFVAFFVAFFPGCIGAGIVAVAIALILHGPEVFNPENPDGMEAVLREPAIFLPMMLSTQVILAGVALGAAYFSPTPMRRRLRLGRAKLPWYGYPVVAVGTLALGMTLGTLIELLGLGDLGVLQEFEEVMTGLRGVALVAATLVIGLAPGFGEEVLFRGYMQTRLVQRWPRLLAIFVTAVLFGVMHMDVVQGAFAICMGLFVGEVVERTGSIWPAIVGHAFNNAVATLLSALVPSDVADAYTGWAILTTATVFALCTLYLLWRPVVPVEEDPAPAVLPMACPASPLG
jgi:hypothetical protein